MTSPVNAPSVQQHVATAIANAASRTDVSFDYLMDQARIESGMRPDARARTSSATGLYQFTKQTWLGAVKQHGTAHGLYWPSNAISRNDDGSYAVARLLRAQFSDVAVLSFLEIPENKRVDVIAVVGGQARLADAAQESGGTHVE